MARRFAATCGLGPEAVDYFEALVAFNQATDNQSRNDSYRRMTSFKRYRRVQKLALGEAAYHSRGYVPAIRELALSKRFRDDPEWISQQLLPPIKETEARAALDILLDLRLLEPGPDGRLRQSTTAVSTGAETMGMHIANYHAEMMQRAAVAMVQIAPQERDISSLTLCLGSEGIANLKHRIQAFRGSLVELAECEREPSQVIQINFQMFPLTRDTAKAASASSIQDPHEPS
jgi:uncharacterized protein (TIGR02147 family)